MKKPAQRPGISNNANLYGTFRGFEWICPWKCNVWVGNTSWPLIQLGDWWYQPHAFSWTFFTMPLVGLLEWEEWYWQIHGELFFLMDASADTGHECKLLYLLVMIYSYYYMKIIWYDHTSFVKQKRTRLAWCTFHLFFVGKPMDPGEKLAVSSSVASEMLALEVIFAPCYWQFATETYWNRGEVQNLEFWFDPGMQARFCPLTAPTVLLNLFFFKIISLKWKSQVLKSLFLPRANGRSTPIKILRGRWSSTQ